MGSVVLAASERPPEGERLLLSRLSRLHIVGELLDHAFTHKFVFPALTALSLALPYSHHTPEFLRNLNGELLKELSLQFTHDDFIEEMRPDFLDALIRFSQLVTCKLLGPSVFTAGGWRTFAASNPLSHVTVMIGDIGPRARFLTALDILDSKIDNIVNLHLRHFGAMTQAQCQWISMERYRGQGRSA